MRKRFKDFSWLIALLVVDAVFFSVINPTNAAAVVVIIGFGLLVATIYAAFDLLLILLTKVLPISEMLKKRLIGAGTLLSGLLIAMQSIGQLTFKDMFALVPLVIVLAFYASYQRKQQRR